MIQKSAPLFVEVAIKMAEAKDATIKVIARGNLALCELFLFLMRALNYLLQQTPAVHPHWYLSMNNFNPN